MVQDLKLVISFAKDQTKKIKGVKAVAEVTGASVENTKLCHKGETLVGEIMSDVAFQAYTVTGKFKDKPQKIRGMFVMYPNVYHIVTRQDSEWITIDNIEQPLYSFNLRIGSPDVGHTIIYRQQTINLSNRASGSRALVEFKTSDFTIIEKAKLLCFAHFAGRISVVN